MNKIFIKALIERKANGGYSVLASTSSIDRQGDSIDQSGWEIDNYMKNPVMLWAHDYSSLPVAKAISVDPKNEKGMVVDYEFAPAEGNPMAEQVKALVDGGFLNAVSVGFIPKERNGNIITRAELLEISFVPVPANQEALQLMHSKGISDEVIAKFFETKEAEVSQAKDDKGAVADELNAIEATEQKWNNWDELCEILSALWDVYFDEATDPAAFPTLLTEAIALMSDLAANGSDDETMQMALKKTLTEKIAAGKVTAVKASARLVVKIGAQHSKATKEAIGTALSHTENATAVLKSLLTKAEETEDGEIGEAEPAEEEAEGEEKGVDELRALLITRDLLRADNTETYSSLTAVNALIKKHEAATK